MFNRIDVTVEFFNSVDGPFFLTHCDVEIIKELAAVTHKKENKTYYTHISNILIIKGSED